MNVHLDESAELYALGALEPHEAALVEQHLAVCADCARRVGRAETAVANMEAAFVPQAAPPADLARRLAAPPLANVARARPRPGWMAAAIAAVFVAVLGLAALGRQFGTLQATIARNDLVFATMANAHFRHASFIGRGAPELVAKAIYAPDGAWVYVIVDQADCACHVVARTAAGARDLGRLHSEGRTATLFVQAAAKPPMLALVRYTDGATLATVRLVY
ncbi:MAG: anti-sigma factor family protein [Vulcanimicrobiaceae bacterium]